MREKGIGLSEFALEVLRRAEAAQPPVHLRLGKGISEGTCERKERKPQHATEITARMNE